MHVGRELYNMRWEAVPAGPLVPASFQNMDEAKAFLPTFSHGGQNIRCDWRTKPGGDPATRRTYCCGAHVACPVQVRLVKVTGTAIELQILRGVEHSAQANEYDRKNASLTIGQKRKMKDAVELNGRPSRVHANSTISDFADGQERVQEMDGSGVEGEPV